MKLTKLYKRLAAGILAAVVFTGSTVFAQGFDVALANKPVLPKRHEVILGGDVFGIKLLTRGIIVTGFGRIGDNKDLTPASKSGLIKGDVIVTADDVEITSCKHFSELLQEKKEITLGVIRNNEYITLKAQPIADSEGNYKIGAWVRDSTAGLGTMTFYDRENKIYAGLGHAIYDIDTKEIMPLKSGEMVRAEINGCKKSEAGTPGELSGTLKSDEWGKIYANSETGLFAISERDYKGESIPVAFENEVTQGEAYIISNVEGTPKKYEVYISDINSNSPEYKNMVVEITDKRLLDITGGIVQGMSGSPIIKDGMLIGAVTHVLINEPENGYGIFAQTMYNNAMNLLGITDENAA